MRKISYHLSIMILGIFFAIPSYTQIIINEISYNPPESGNDSLEYIELYHVGGPTVNIGGWYFLTGVQDTLPNMDLNPGDYFVTAINAQAMMNVFGITVHQWLGNALSNSGESIVLVDSGGGLIDSVQFDDADPWPVEPDGSGPSLELNDPGDDNNDGANWHFSSAGIGIIINGFEVAGTPGAANSGGGGMNPAVTIEAANLKFTPKNAVVQTGDLVRWVNNEAIPHNVNGSQASYAGNPESIFSGAPAAGPWQFDYIPMTAGLYNYHCDVHQGLGMTGTVSVYNPLTYTDFPLPHLRLTDGMNGQHIFDGVPTTVTGVVHGINFLPAGYSFYVINPDNVGINVFSFTPGGYTVNEGDLVKVFGVIDQFNGLLEIVPDVIELMEINQSLTPWREISEVTESDESSHLLVTLNGVDSIQTTGGSGFNVFARNVQDDPILIRIDIDSGLDTNQIGNGVGVQVRGIGTQFDPSFPFTEGYQVLALEFFPPPGFPLLAKDAFQISPNPAFDQVRISGEWMMERVELFSMDGKSVLTKEIESREDDLDIASLHAGIFVVKVTTAEGIWVSRVVKR